MDTYQIVYIIAAVIIAAGAGYLLYISRAFGQAEALRQLSLFADAVRVFVAEADKMLNMSNDQRYTYVYVEASKWLTARGITVAPETIRQLIEGAVDIIHRAREKPDELPLMYKN